MANEDVVKFIERRIETQPNSGAASAARTILKQYVISAPGGYRNYEGGFADASEAALYAAAAIWNTHPDYKTEWV